MVLGILGGTFNPIHKGHLLLAQTAMHHLSLDKTLIMPAGQPPFKADYAPNHHRLAMCQLACQGTGLTVSQDELQHSGMSYTVDTLSRVHEQYPNSTVWFIIGEDNLHQVTSWHDAPRLLQLCNLAVALRPPDDAQPGSMPAQAIEKAYAQAHLLTQEYNARIAFLPFVGLPLSSSLVRQAAARGQDVAPYTGQAVADYIAQHGLYQ